MSAHKTPKSKPTTAVVPAQVPEQPEKRLRYPRNPALAHPAEAKSAREFQALVMSMRALKLGVPRNIIRKTFTVSAKGMDPKSFEPKTPDQQEALGTIALKELRDFIEATPRVKQALVAAKKLPA